MRPTRFTAAGLLVSSLMLVASLPLAGQEREETPSTEDGEAKHVLHPNHFGGFIGFSTRSDVDELAPTIGLEYARVLSRHWAVISYVELVSSQLERDMILAAGVAYYPRTIPVSLVLAVGVEGADKEVIENGEAETESELAFLVRVGISYAFSLTPTAALAPTFIVDQAEGRTTFVFGLGMAVGF